MSNSRFEEYVTGVAFNLQLTKAQINAMNSLLLPDNALSQLNFIFNSRTMVSLWHKGLIDRDEKSHYILSEEGKVVIKLLDMAGLIEHSKKKLVPQNFVKKVAVDD